MGYTFTVSDSQAARIVAALAFDSWDGGPLHDPALADLLLLFGVKADFLRSESCLVCHAPRVGGVCECECSSYALDRHRQLCGQLISLASEFGKLAPESPASAGEAG